MSQHLEKTAAQGEKRNHLRGLNYGELCKYAYDVGLTVLNGSQAIHPQIFTDISSLINPYADRGIMLRKTADDIRENYLRGDSVIMVYDGYAPDGNHRTLISHAGFYQLIDLPLPQGTITVGEVGGVIKGDELKMSIDGGYTVGEITIALLQRSINEKAAVHPQARVSLLLATVKNDNVESAFWEVGMDRAPFESLALLTHATCVCNGVAEIHNTANSPSCRYRMDRQSAGHSVIIRSNLIQTSGQKTTSEANEDGKCRLVVHDLQSALESERLLREYFQIVMGFAFPAGRVMNKEISMMIYGFYNRIGARFM